MKPVYDTDLAVGRSCKWSGLLYPLQGSLPTAQCTVLLVADASSPTHAYKRDRKQALISVSVCMQTYYACGYIRLPRTCGNSTHARQLYETDRRIITRAFRSTPRHCKPTIYTLVRVFKVTQANRTRCGLRSCQQQEHGSYFTALKDESCTHTGEYETIGPNVPRSLKLRRNMFAGAQRDRKCAC